MRKLDGLEAAWLGGFLSFAAWLRERYPHARLFSRFTAAPLPPRSPTPSRRALQPSLVSMGLGCARGLICFGRWNNDPELTWSAVSRALLAELRVFVVPISQYMAATVRPPYPARTNHP